MSKARQHGLRRIFAAPAAIGLASVAGLVVALTGDGLRDAMSWIALSIPALVVIWAMRRS
ncbi:hypothetical protein FHR22_003899 [Sphingopyxis panaciterrae]|uniref:hypothetical protein n=1 Tax=Sphingopyxis panaciterrae TaxID=363841 RepID=UPI0014249FDB|nr:hypothetical protein [Sphingopyxis panaciterrae]NIJ39165.1 hypothetical protein [Sphingopyxis panaciterrae]